MVIYLTIRFQGCIAAAEATAAGEILVRDIYTYQYSILVQCGARGFCSVSRLLPYPAGMENPLETDHISKRRAFVYGYVRRLS